MKKPGISLLILCILFLFNSCDKLIYYDYYIINKCDASIKIQILDYKNKSYYMEIYSNDNQVIYQAQAINKLDKDSRLVEHYFKNIIIEKDGNISKINHVDKNLWKLQPTSDVHADVYLTVTDSSFEN